MGFFTDLIGGAINSYIENKDTDDDELKKVRSKRYD